MQASAALEKLLSFMEVHYLRMVDVFRKIDADGNGTIEASEVGDTLLALGVEVPHVVLAELFSLIDVDGDGGVSVDEFLTRMREV